VNPAVFNYASRAFASTHRSATRSLRVSSYLATDCLALAFTVALLPISIILATIVTRRLSMAVVVVSALSMWLILDSAFQRAFGFRR